MSKLKWRSVQIGNKEKKEKRMQDNNAKPFYHGIILCSCLVDTKNSLL